MKTNKNDRRTKILQFEAFKEHGKQLVKSNDFNIEEDCVTREKQKEIFNKLSAEMASGIFGRKH